MEIASRNAINLVMQNPPEEPEEAHDTIPQCPYALAKNGYHHCPTLAGRFDAE